MQITIQVDNAGAGETRRSFCVRLKSVLCHLSIFNAITLFTLVSILLLALYLCKTYIRSVLFWLENQDSSIISLTIIFLFTIVALPISVGYIVLVVANGYLFGVVNGFCMTVVGANLGLLFAHYILKLVAHHHSVRRLVDNETAKAIMRVISGPLCFKIVLCSRLTPIPFGLQNTIFALSNVSGKLYHLASMFGLLPAQMVGVYVGSTLRSMQDVIENRNISTSTYIFAGLQLALGCSLMFWIGTKARKELLRVLAEGENKLTPSEKVANFV
ncbi:PREDICTED: transmembrane protein 64 [Nicrophorus vespilloides]|uniref:Transmembrane protein 64 n=1 Tax=Nicrophorus vespilloides TaxID=110193 RepID=A0ABM1MZ78_NICVS|nr:PREDICTED: transmembrane protein 64 [Nicrophorus vespilloides]